MNIRSIGKIWNRRQQRRAVCLGDVAVLTLLWAFPGRAETAQYTYDAMQRLTRVEHADGATVDYVYDLLGNRMIKTTTLPGAPTNQPPDSCKKAV